MQLDELPGCDGGCLRPGTTLLQPKIVGIILICCRFYHDLNNAYDNH